MSNEIKEYLSVFFKHIYDILQHPERLLVGSLLVYIISSILLMFALSISNLPEWGKIFETTASYGALILLIFWMLVLFGFILTPPLSDNSSIKNESWIYDPSANKLMLWEIREHCKNCKTEDCNNCALRKYKEDEI